jgi:hypothetical protein
MEQVKLWKEVRNWMYRNARPLEIARWRYHFEQGSVDEVLEAIAVYQNEDGGFGHALEADAWNPNSSPIQTFHAIEMLKEINFTDEKHPVIQGILSYLDSGSDFNGMVWNNVIATNNSYPHAPWWHSDSESTCHRDYNPTAGLVGFALCYSDKNSRLYQLCSRIAKEAVNALYLNKETNMHTLTCYLVLYEYCEQAQITDLFSLSDLKQELVKRVKETISTDTDNWATGYVCKPSQFIKSPESLFYPENRDIAEQECDFIINTRNKDGIWDITWGWAAYPDEWAISKNWWKGSIVINNVLYLKKFHRLFN